MWAYLELISLDSPFELMFHFSWFIAPLQALNLKNHDCPFLRKFRSFGIVLGMGAQISVGVCSYVLVLGFASLVYIFSGCLFFIKNKNKNKKTANRKKKKKKRRICNEKENKIVWGKKRNKKRGLGVYFHAYFWLIPHCSSIFFGSLATYPYIPSSTLSIASLQPLISPFDLYVHVCWVWMLEACQAYGSACFSWVLWV